MKFPKDDDVVDSVNDNIQGLSAGVYTRDTARAYKIASCINAGVIGDNGGHLRQKHRGAALR
jgi:acyl-CoA reductase-like NAD-dependent aldehyde dehydrogenase